MLLLVKRYMVVVDVEALGVLQMKDTDTYIASFRPKHGEA